MTQEEASQQAFSKAFANESLRFIRVCEASWLPIDFMQPEPKVVHDYLLKKDVGVDFLNQNFCANFKKRYPRFSMKFSSIFIHQRPYVLRTATTSPNPKKCELGDICLIYVFVDKVKTVRWASASLFQAKKRWILDSLDQQLLYDSSPGYAYTAKSFSQRTFNKLPNRLFPTVTSGRGSALKYLVLPPNRRPSVRMAPSARGLCQPWGATVARMLLWNGGLRFSPGQPTTDNWSSILDDLIRMGRKVIPAGKSKVDRSNKSELDEIIDTFNHFESYEKYSEDGGEDSVGVPIMLAIVQDTELMQAG